MCNGCKVKYSDYYSDNIYTWCTNCGNYAIHQALKRSLVKLKIPPYQVLLCFDIGCHGNGADKIGGYRFHGLHGRVIPFAVGAHLANHKMPVIAFGGDGGTLDEGINHLIHAVRSNYNITFILHNNGNFGLTKGQVTPTSPKGLAMNSNPFGLIEDQINVCKFLLNLEPSFVARTFSGNIHQMERVFVDAITHKGFSFVEILQACPTYNKVNTHEKIYSKVYDVDELDDYDPQNLSQALKVSSDLDNKIATGVLYFNKTKKDFYSRLPQRLNRNKALIDEVKNY
ncbi:MAG: 2-oxoglutarate ferredoxin oxidoreductase subunit beta [Candidatus Dojkabacteria bacterium]|nr:MAG: 2-oxoglutarate ferredoxin oxidoreductase subunit beta [Candidatus Dojkabacteria bacterium]GIW58904.1 MAG: 2-oxoglutarate ferredoxin oxidoreductase subunit beta [Candidatus Dojkabacteria bacterium]